MQRSKDLEELGCTPWVTYMLMHTEVVETILSFDKSQQDKLAGAFFRYFMTGKEQQIPKALKPAWTPLRISAKRTRESILLQARLREGGTTGATDGDTTGATDGDTDGTHNCRNHLALSTQHSSSSSALSPHPHPQHPEQRTNDIKHATDGHPADARGDDLADSVSDSEAAEHDRLERLLANGGGTDGDRARYCELHPRVMAARKSGSRKRERQGR